MIPVEEIYIPMKDAKEWIKKRNEYLKSIDKKYGTGYAIRYWRDREDENVK